MADLHTPSDIWLGGRIETLDPARPVAEALAVADGKIIAVGADHDIAHLAGPSTRRHTLGGKCLMPGLVESHTHALMGACRTLFDIYVGYGASFDDLIAATRARAAALPPGAFIYGGPWRYDMRGAMGAEPRLALDAVSTAHPIALCDTSQHIFWCNSLALELAGLGPGAADIPGGVIERHPETGAPTGVLAEAAQGPVRALLQYSDAQMADAAREMARYLNGYGFTAFKEPMAYEAEMRAYHAADQRGELTLHMAAHLVRFSPLGGEFVPYEELERLRRDYASANIRTGFAKLFLDGVAPGFTASFIDPYRAESGYDVAGHDPDATLLLTREALDETVTELDRRGFVVKMHAVGDNAIRAGLDAIAAARRANGASGLRHEIAHSVFVSDDDLSRFKALDAVAEMSPKLWFPNAATPAQIAVLGEARLRKAHRFADLLAAGAEMTYASDWPASAPDANPWPGLAGMLTRRNTDPAFSGALAPDQAISLEEALPLFTRNGARSLGMEAEIGALSPGKWADFIMLDRPLSALTPEEIGAVTVEATYWKGRQVFGR